MKHGQEELLCKKKGLKSPECSPCAQQTCRGRGGIFQSFGRHNMKLMLYVCQLVSFYIYFSQIFSPLLFFFFLQQQEDEENLKEEDDRTAVFSRRKLESNWDRYEEAERAEEDDNMPSQRGTDYHVLLESAGDSFTQFRFAEEKDWEMDPFTASQMSAVFLDLPALAQSLQQVPLHQRLNLEAELVQVSTPVDLPAVSLAPKQEGSKMEKFPPPSGAFKGLGTNQIPLDSQLSTVPVKPKEEEDDGDEELDQLLCLQKPVSGDEGQQMVSATEEKRDSPEKGE
uniref:Apoptosis, caspase activation inhibitor n=1 Tax=Cyprinodon variegatus TaxID=28743 RepID=A0A3Q2ED33_CYPVA